jgi:hypothetical protein
LYVKLQQALYIAAGAVVVLGNKWFAGVLFTIKKEESDKPHSSLIF